jgi:hypothetical protein
VGGLHPEASVGDAKGPEVLLSLPKVGDSLITDDCRDRRADHRAPRQQHEIFKNLPHLHSIGWCDKLLQRHNKSSGNASGQALVETTKIG